MVFSWWARDKLAREGAKGEPMAMPRVCRYLLSPKVKSLHQMEMERSLMRSGVGGLWEVLELRALRAMDRHCPRWMLVYSPETSRE